MALFKRKSSTGLTMFAAAWIELKNDIVFIFAQSGGAGAVADHDAFSTHMPFPPQNGELGAAVRQALSASRYLDPKKMGWDAIERFMYVEAQARNQEYVKQAMKLTGVKSETAFDRGIKACSILRMDDQFKLTPTLDGKGSWGKHGATPADLRYFPVGASDEEIEKVVLETLSLSK